MIVVIYEVQQPLYWGQLAKVQVVRCVAVITRWIWAAVYPMLLYFIMGGIANDHSPLQVFHYSDADVEVGGTFNEMFLGNRYPTVEILAGCFYVDGSIVASKKILSVRGVHILPHCEHIFVSSGALVVSMEEEGESYFPKFPDN